MALSLEAYGLIGDCQTAALVGSDGSIDWLCLPAFDSGACFAALLGDVNNGRWLIAPAGPVHNVRRRYRDDTLVLETDFHTDTGIVTVVDCMPPRGLEADVVRLVIGRQGAVRMRMELIVRFDYGSIVPWVRHLGDGIMAVAGANSLIVQSPVAMHGENLTTVAEFTIAADQQVPFVMQWFPSHHPPPQTIEARQAIRDTETWWRDWSRRCTYEGRWREAVIRSLITLKALTYAPTGGIVAAPTTSLPEQLGGVRNWDYRYCWLRDATFTLYSLLLAGFQDEAIAWRDWLLRAVAGDPSKLQIMYGILGERRLTELELPWLQGYADSRPVRIGNAASEQFQLDVYSEVLDMLYLCRREGIARSEFTWPFERALLQFLESVWREPDQGIWEVRGPRRHFTHSKVMAWVAFDRAVKIVASFGEDGPSDHWAAIRDQIHREVCEHGFNSQRDTFVQYFGGNEVDASLLMLPLVGFLPATDSRMQGTIRAIERDLLHDGLVHRYRTQEMIDGLPPGEGAFLPCSFWYVDNLCLLGRHDEGAAIFEKLLTLRSEVGLLAEEYDLVNRRLVGNFPQAFSHVGLVNTARNLTCVAGPAHHRTEG